MFKRYEVSVYLDDDIIYLKTFKSLNDIFKVLSGFDESVYIEVLDLITDRIIPNCECKHFIKELISDF